MRSVSSTLEAAQSSLSRTPYVRLLFTSADGNTVYDYTERLLELEHHEEPYNDYATIILRDNDREVAAIKGYWVDIGYGDITDSGGAEYPDNGNSRLWVVAQYTTSAEGVAQSVLELAGKWSILRQQLFRAGAAPDQLKSFTSTTIYDIINYVLTDTSTPGGLGWLSFTLEALGTEDDSIIDTYEPPFDTNTAPFENAATVLDRLIHMTKCYLLARAGLGFKIRFPEAADAADLKVYSDAVPYFHEYAERRDLVLPNHFIVYANEAGSWNITGDAEDTDETAAYMDVTQLILAPDITTQPNADNRAAALLSKAQAERLSGRLLMQHDCRIELYDKITIYDRRGY